MNRIFQKFDACELSTLRGFVRKARRRGVALVMYLLWEDEDNDLEDCELSIGHPDDVDLLKETIKINFELEEAENDKQ